MDLLNAYLRSPRVQRALNKKTKKDGFTLIELVIVVAILAILAAIGIPAFNNAQVRAREASAKTGLATALKECKVSELLDGAPTHTPLETSIAVPFTLSGATSPNCYTPAVAAAPNAVPPVVAAPGTAGVYTSQPQGSPCTYTINLYSGAKTGLPVGCEW